METNDYHHSIAFIARLRARRPHDAPVHRHLLLHRLIITRGGGIVAGCFTHRSLPDCDLAPHRVLGTFC